MRMHRETWGSFVGEDKLAYSRPQGILTDLLSDPSALTYVYSFYCAFSSVISVREKI